MYIDCSNKELFVFKKIANAAEELGMPAFIIGGFVRDKIIGRATKDADIVCLGDGILLANKVAERFSPKPTVAFFKNQLQFHIEEATFQAIKDNKERIKIISQERITDELNKIMLSRKPSVGWHLLFTSGLLSIIFPQMVDLAGAEYIDGKGHKDNF